MSHQRSFVHHCSPLNVQVTENNFCLISGNSQKTILKDAT